ncbi:hypothetical protein GCM10027040_19450 [Halomonas shantousis]
MTLQSLFSRRFRIATFAAILFFLAALTTGGVILQRHQALENKLRENLIWMTYQFDREVREFRFVLEVERDVALEALLLRHDILYSRMQLFQHGDMARELSRIDVLEIPVQQAIHLIETMDALLQTLPEGAVTLPESLKLPLRVESEALQDVASTILVDTNAYVAGQRTFERSRLLELYGLALALIVMLMMSGAVLVRALIREGRARHAKAQLLERRGRELNEAVARAEAASRAKSEFMAVMSHEIRTPLNGVVGMTELLSGETLTPRGGEYLQALRQSATGLQAVINDVLDYTKIESGALDLDIRPFELATFVEQLCSGYQLRAQGSAVAFCHHVDDTLPHCVSGEVNRLRQILLNLLNNAFKFTPSGLVELRVSAASPSQVRFEVRDTGCGIAREDQARLFEPFTQVDTSIARRHEGTGLGLAICQRLVQAMGGELGVNSQPGLGSLFWFVVALPEAPRLQVERHDDACAVMPKTYRILIVEDNPINQVLTRAMLERLQRDDAPRFDLVLMDMQMPVLDGLETTRRWRATETRGHLPIVAMTANVMPEDLERCRQSGMDDVLCKPFTGDELCRTLVRQLSPTARSTEPDAGESAVSLAPASANGDDIAGTALLDAEIGEELAQTLDREALDRLLQTYLTRLESRLVTLEAGLAAEDRQALQREAHSLKGASASLGCAAIAAEAAALETAAPTAAREALRHHLEQLARLKEATREALRGAGLLVASAKALD